MAIRGRMVRPADDESIDPLITLLVAVVKRAQRDVAIPVDSRNVLRPNAYEKATAAEFLEELYASAARRTP